MSVSLVNLFPDCACAQLGVSNYVEQHLDLWALSTFCIRTIYGLSYTVFLGFVSPRNVSPKTGTCLELYAVFLYFIDGHVRLVGDARDEVGAVELFHPLTGWTGICADPDHAPSWLRDNQAAEIVCRQLGYQGGRAYADRSV